MQTFTAIIQWSALAVAAYLGVMTLLMLGAQSFA
jgi:hypothetical protein